MSRKMYDNIGNARSMVPPKTLKSFSQKAFFPWLSDILIDWAIIIMTITAIGYTWNIVVAFIGIIIIGNRQHAISLLGHEGTHYIISKNKKLNDTLTNFFSFWWLGITVSGYRNLHNRHHRDLATNKDPELAHKAARAPQWDLPTTPFKVLKYASMDLIGYSIPDFRIIVTFSKPNKNTEYIPLIGLHAIVTTSFITLGFWWVPAIWYFCLVTTFMMFFRLRLWVEHQGSDLAHRLHLTWLEGAILAPHNGWYHWEHHIWPTVPYNRMAELRKMTEKAEPIINFNDLVSFYKGSNKLKSGIALREA